MKNLHQLLLQTIKEHTSPSRLLSRVIADKLEKQGIAQAAKYLDKIEPQIKSLLENSTLENLHPIQIETGDEEIDSRNIQLALDPSDIDHIIAQTEKSVEKIIPGTADDIAKLLLRRVKHDANKGGLEARRLEKLEFESQLWNRWGRAFDLLALEIALAREAGELANNWLRKRPRKKDSFVVEVLTRLHARACQVAGEVESLLSTGYADGAIARWRTLHELAVVAFFIKDKGNDVAERYLLHTSIDSLRGARQYNQLTHIIGCNGFTQKELTALEREAQKLVQRFGTPFREEYGWAANALGNSNPRFTDIEKSVDLERLRPFYKLASHNVHAGPKGAVFRLGLLKTSDPILLAGPSNAGLDEAGRLTAISLSQITICLLLHRITFDSLIWSKVHLTLSHEVENAFIRVQKKLEREERAIVKQNRAKKGTGGASALKRQK